LVQDSLGHVVAVYKVGESTAIEKYEYDPYGNRTIYVWPEAEVLELSLARPSVSLSAQMVLARGVDERHVASTSARQRDPPAQLLRFVLRAHGRKPESLDILQDNEESDRYRRPYVPVTSRPGP